MIKFRQKMYFAPIAAPLLAKAGTALGSTGLMNAVGVAGLAQGGIGMAQQARDTKAQMDQANKHQQQNARLQKQQMRVEAQKAEAINNLANSSAGQTPAGQAVQQGLFSERKVLKNQKLFAMRYNMKDIKGFGKDLGNHIWKNKKHIGGFLSFGSLAAGGKYLVDKAIQRDKSVMNNSDANSTTNTQKVYSDVKLLPGKTSKNIGTKLKGSSGAIMGGLIIGGLGPISSYISDKANQNKLSKKSEKQFSLNRIARKGLLAIKRGAWGREQNLNIINKINNSQSTWKPSSWKWLRKVKHNPVRGIANVYNSFNMMGGETGMQNFRNSLTGKTSSGSKLSRDVSNFMKKHGATSMATIGAIGGGALFKASELVDKGTEKAIRALDKNAFKYTDSKEERIQ